MVVVTTLNRIQQLPAGWVHGIIHQCHHRQGYSVQSALLYCFILGLLYVASFYYLLIPPNVRKLERDDPLHIQWRSLAALIVSVFAIGSYPLLFCNMTNIPGRDGNQEEQQEELPETFSIVGVVFRFQYIQGVLLHTIILYFGPIVASILRVYEIRKMRIRQGYAQSSFIKSIFEHLLRPSIVSALNPHTDEEYWINVRNFIIAPLTEEIVFRGCMVPALLASGMSSLKVSLIAPLFFGIAHVHHAVTRIAKNGEKVVPVVIMTIFQFMYTSLFGSYASYAFIRTGSILAVSISHAYCNWMGLPDASFMQERHPMYQYRTVILIAFMLGVYTFKWQFSTDYLLPLPPKLLDAVHGTSEINK